MKKKILILLLLISTICWGQENVPQIFKIEKTTKTSTELPKHVLKKCRKKTFGLPERNTSHWWGTFIRKIIPYLAPENAKDPKIVKHLKKEYMIYTFYNKTGKPIEEWNYIIYSKGNVSINGKNVTFRKAPYVTFWNYDTNRNLIKREAWRYESNNQDINVTNKEIYNCTYYFYQNNILQKSFSPSITSQGGASWASTSTYLHNSQGDLILRKDSSVLDSLKSSGTSVYTYDAKERLISISDSTNHLSQKWFYSSNTTYEYDSLGRVVKTHWLSSAKNKKRISVTSYFYVGNSKQLKGENEIIDSNEKVETSYDKYGNIKKSKWYNGDKLMGYEKYSNSYY